MNTPAILEEDLPTVGEARSEGGLAEVESAAVTDDGDDGNPEQRSEFSK